MKNPLQFASCAMLFVLPALLIYSCKSNSTASNTKKAVDPIFADAVPFRDFDVNADALDTIKLSEGTNIIVPAGTFVDANGSAVKGKVQLHYRAYYTAGQIAASGIMMDYDTAGVHHIFTSAGMFEMTGTQNGKAIAIAPGKNIKMNFASTRDDANVSFYNLDTVASQWNFLATTKAETNKLKEKILAEISKFAPKPVQPKAFDPSMPVINIDVDQNDHPELSGYNNIVWQYSGEGNDPEKNKWIYDTDWTNVEMKMDDSTSCSYTMKLSNTTKSFETKVNPALRGDDYGSALQYFKKKMIEFAKSEKDRLVKLAAASTILPFIRDVVVGRFGLHNCDMFANVGSPANVSGVFHFDDAEFENNKENVTIILVNDRGRIGSNYSAASTQSMIYLSDKENCMIAVLRGTHKAAILNNKEFFQAIYDGKGKPSAKFNLHATSKEVQGSEDIDALIENL